MWNPWRVKCPHCHAKLKMSGFVKIFSMLAIPLGLMYGSVPIYMEETKQWAAQDSFIYFAITVPALMALSYALWPRTKLLNRA